MSTHTWSRPAARTDVVARASSGEYPRIGDVVTMVAKTGRVHVFDAGTGERLNGAVGLAPEVPAAAVS